MVTAIERKTRLLCDTRFQFDRSGGVFGRGNDAGQFLGQDRRIVHCFVRVVSILSDSAFVQKRAQRVEVERPGVAVRGCNQDVRGRNAGFPAGDHSRPVRDGLRNADQIAENQRCLFLGLLKVNRFGVQRVVHACAEPFVEVAAHPVADRRGDLRYADTRLQFARLRSRRSE